MGWKDALEMWQSGRSDRKKLEVFGKYYEGNHKILGREELYSDGSPKSEIVVNWIGVCLDLYLGAIVAAPFQVVKRNDDDTGEGIDEYRRIYDYNDLRSLDTRLLRNALIYGYSVESYGFDGDEVMLQTDSPLNWHIVFDENDTPMEFVRMVSLPRGVYWGGEYQKDPIRVMTHYTLEGVTVYTSKDGGQTFDEYESQPLKFAGEMPLNLWVVRDERKPFIPQSAMILNDDYNDLESATSDDIRMNTDAKLVLYNVDAGWLLQAETQQALKELNLLPLQEGSKAEYMSRPVNVEYQKVKLDRLRKEICAMMKVPDVDNIVGTTGATSGIALRLKFLATEQDASTVMAYVERCIANRIYNLNLYNSALGRPTIEEFDAIVQWVVPTNRLEEWGAIKSLDGVVSHRTQLSLLSDIDDPETELERMKKQEMDMIPEAQAALQNQQADMDAEAVEPDMERMVTRASDMMISELERRQVVG